MKKIIIAIVVIFSVKMSTAQVPNWAVTPSDYQFSMTVTTGAMINCQTDTEVNDMIGAFIGGVCHGTINFGTDVNGNQLAYLIVYSNQSQGEEVNFIFYDASEDIQINLLDTIIFEENGTLGTSDNPFMVINNNPPTALKLSDYILTDVSAIGDVLGGFTTEDLDNEVYTYSFINNANNDNDLFSVVGDSLVIEHDVDIQMQSTYTIEVEAENGMGCTISDSFTLEVNNTNEGPTDILLANEINYINENEPVGTLIDSLQVEDLTLIDLHSYTLAADILDNNQFQINGTALSSNEVFDYETQNEYMIEIMVEDAVGNTFYKEMIIEVRDVVEAGDLKANNIITPNGDGYNDFFTVPNIELFDNFEFVVFNENGNQVFRRASSVGYNNLWNGKNQEGKDIPSGVYYYYMKDYQMDIEFKGEITLLRD